MTTQDILENAKKVKNSLAQLSTEHKNAAIINMAAAIESESENILKANAVDVAAAQGKIPDVMIDRLSLNEKRIYDMAEGLRSLARLPDPIGNVLEEFERPNGLLIKKVSTSIGVIGIIYESRPNVTADAAGLSIKSGNVCVLRIGKEAYGSAKAIVLAMRRGLKKSGVNENAVNLIADTSRESAYELMTAVGYIDLLIPRGGKNLIQSCVENAKVPCIQTGTGICHIYVEDYADKKMALNIIENAKCSRPSVCNAAEVCLVNRKIAESFLPMLAERLNAQRHPVLIKAHKNCFDLFPDKKNVILAEENDFDTEFSDYILAVKLVDGVKEAVNHISQHSTGHSESIITENTENAHIFTKSVDSSAVYVNASTRFTDGGEFGFGCEMGISTQKIHARGPMGLRELTSYKYIIEGRGQTR